MKIGIIGLGMVGKEVLLYMFQFSAAQEIVVYDINKERTQAEIWDLEDSIPLGHFSHYSQMSVANDYSDIKDCDYVFVNASIPAKNLTDRRSLLAANEKLMKEIGEAVAKYSPKSVVIITSNPVDAMVYYFIQYSGMPYQRVMGSGDVLDTVRLRRYISQHFGVSAFNVTSFVLGEHGNSSFVPWSIARVAGVHVDEFSKMNNLPLLEREKAINFVRQRGLDIYNTRGYTDHGIGASVYSVFTAIAQNEHRIMPVSTLLHGEYGISDLVIGALSVIGKNGVERVIEYPLTDEEIKLYHASADFIREAMK
jgi:L-lactate dehydrogenase